jgi:DNA-binding response OmpR family regulator
MTSNPFRLLVVDDDPSIRQMLLIGLRQEGYLVEIAGGYFAEWPTLFI